MKSNRFWAALLGAVLIVSVASIFLLRQGTASLARIYQDGELIRTLDLSAITEPYTFTVESKTGTNVIAVEEGRVRVSEADCPDGSCIRQGWADSRAVTIVCLPHRLVIEIVRGEPPEYDAVA